MRRRPIEGIDWDFVAYWLLTIFFVGYCVLSLGVHLSHYVTYPERVFGDARLYWHATEAWLNGGDPWTTRSAEGVIFAGPPTTLLLNLPLIPFGPEAARVFWATTGLVGWVFVIRRLRLAPWFILFPPFIEGYLPGSPDPALAGLIVLGAGGLAVITKPYAVPAMIADRRWKAIGVGAVIGLVTLPLLPWGLFVNQAGIVQGALAAQSHNLSAWGNPPLMAATALALVSLGPRLALELVVPALWPGAQAHYTMFSARAAATTPYLALVLSIPGFAAFGIVVYAIWVRGSGWLRARHRTSGGASVDREDGP